MGFGFLQEVWSMLLGYICNFVARRSMLGLVMNGWVFDLSSLHVLW